MIGSDPKYQAIINAYKAGQLATTAPQYNPIYDIRSEQIAAGELPAGSQFPIPQLVTTPTTEEDKTKDTFDPCPPGYQLVDGVCQPDTMFQQGGGDSGQPTQFESPYYGDIYLPMAGGMATGDMNVPYGEYRTPMVNTELARFAAQKDYQPTIGSTIGDLFRKGMQFSPIIGLLNAFGLGPSYTEKVTPRESILDVVAAEQAAKDAAMEAALKREGQQLRAEMTRDLLDAQTQAERAKAQGAGSFTVGKDSKPIKGTGYDPSKAGKSVAGARLRGGI